MGCAGCVSWMMLRAEGVAWVLVAGLLLIFVLGTWSIPGTKAKVWFVAGALIGFWCTIGCPLLFLRLAFDTSGSWGAPA